MAIKENPAGDANANSAKLVAARKASESGNSVSYDSNGNPKFTQTSVSSMSSGSGGSSSSNYSNYSNSDLTSYINKLADAQLAAKQSAINKARDEAVNGYNQQISTAPETYQPLRNQADLTGAKNSRAITEQMAAQGNWRSGANQSAQTANNASTANAIAGYNQQQQDFVNNLKSAIEQVKTNAGYDSAQAVSDTEASKLQSLINQANTDRTFNYQTNQDSITNAMNAAGLTGNYNGQSTLSAKAQALQKAMEEAQLTGNYNGVQTLASQLQNHNIAEDQFNNGLAYANIYGSYQGKDTYAKQVQDLQNALAVQQLAADQAYKNASLAASKSKSSSGGGSSTASIAAQKYAQEQDSISATAEAFSRLNELANAGKTRSQILKAYKDNYADYANNNVDMDKLWKLIDESFQWDGK